MLLCSTDFSTNLNRYFRRFTINFRWAVHTKIGSKMPTSTFKDYWFIFLSSFFWIHLDDDLCRKGNLKRQANRLILEMSVFVLMNQLTKLSESRCSRCFWYQWTAFPVVLSHLSSRMIICYEWILTFVGLIRVILFIKGFFVRERTELVTLLFMQISSYAASLEGKLGIYSIQKTLSLSSWCD